MPSEHSLPKNMLEKVNELCEEIGEMTKWNPTDAAIFIGAIIAISVMRQTEGDEDRFLGRVHMATGKFLTDLVMQQVEEDNATRN